MLGLGSSISRSGKIGPTIIRDGLVLKHDYNAGAVEPCSTGAASFDHTTGDFIDLGDLAAFDFASNFTLSAWIKAEGSSGYNAIMSNYETDKGWWFILNAGKLRMGLENQIDTSAQGLDLRDGKWHHVAATCTTSNIILYTDGVLIYEKTSETWTPAQTSSATTMIGKRTGIDEFDGYMCNVGVWSAALTQPQIKSIMHKDYASLSASEKTNLVSWWNLDSTMVTANDGGKFGALDSHYGGGSELGSEMWDGTNSDTTHWVKFGNNEISSDDGAVKITYKDHASGYYIYLRDSSHLNADLVVGKFYRLTFSTKINNGSVVWSLSEEGEDSYSSDSLTSTSFVTKQIDFLATATTDHYLYPASMDGTEEVWIKDISLKLINGNTGTLS